MTDKAANRPKRHSAKSGLPPGALVYIGEHRESDARAEMYLYDGKSCEHRVLPLEEIISQSGPHPGVAWINLEGIHDVTPLEKIGGAFGLHDLTLEDIPNTEQRSKLEDYPDYLFLVVRMLRYNRSERSIISEQLSMVLGGTFLLSFQEGVPGDVFDPIRERLKSDSSKIRTLGPDYLCYSMLDALVDNYFIILESVGEEIEELEERLLGDATQENLQSIHRIRRELIFLRKSAWPLREVILSLQRHESKLVSADTALYLRDVYDHVIQVIDTIEMYRDTLSGLADLYMSTISNRMNEVMKVLTIIATVFIPLTFIAGVYGMNFDVMPELRWPWGYLFAWGIMLAVAGGMLVYFRRKKWI